MSGFNQPDNTHTHAHTKHTHANKHMSIFKHKTIYHHIQKKVPPCEWKYSGTLNKRTDSLVPKRENTHTRTQTQNTRTQTHPHTHIFKHKTVNHHTQKKVQGSAWKCSETHNKRTLIL